MDRKEATLENLDLEPKLNVPTLKVFIFEDDPDRIKAFRDRFESDHIPEGMTCVLTATDNLEEAKALLKDCTFDLVFLDHDLQEVSSNSPSVLIQAKTRVETGYDLAHWLGMNPDIAAKHGKYYTHSLNLAGRDRILGAFRALSINCIEAPYLWEDKFFREHITFDNLNPKEQLMGLQNDLARLTERLANLDCRDADDMMADYTLARKITHAVDALRDAESRVRGVLAYVKERFDKGPKEPPTPHCPSCGVNPSKEQTEGCVDDQGCGYWRKFLKWHLEHQESMALVRATMPPKRDLK